MTGINISGIASAPTPPVSAVLYGALGGTQTTSDLYIIDVVTAGTTSVGPIGFAITGLAFHPGTGVLYGVTNNSSASNPRSLVTINTSTGAGTLVGALGISNGIADIGFSSAGVLYGYHPQAARTLHTIDLSTGAATQVSTTAFAGGSGFGCDLDANDLMFICPQRDTGAYYTIDVSNGGQTFQVNLGGSHNSPIAACSFTDPAVFWCIVNDGNISQGILATIDTLTGAVSYVGNTIYEMDGIAWTVRATTGAPHPN